MNKGACCSICLIAYYCSKESVLITACGHVFHSICINTWLQRDKECPLCRETIGTNTSRVYLSFIGEQDSNDNSDDQYTVTGNTPFNNARITSSVLRLESLIKRETNETSKKHAQLIMLNIKQLIDPLVNEGSSLSESLRSNPNTHQTISVNSPAKAIKIEDCNQISTVQSNRYFLRSRKKFKPDCS